MVRSSRQKHFFYLREQFPFFIFEKQEYSLTASGLEVRFTFNLSDKHKFYPTVFIPRKPGFLPDEKIADHLGNVIFNLGMIELISYWKAACSPRVIIRPYGLHPEQVDWWKKLYFHGLGEFFYLNSIHISEDNFMQMEVASSPVPGAGKFFTDDSVIIPVGGGKDSVVTLELLGSRPGSVPLILNPRHASLGTIAAKGFTGDQLIEIRRTIDPGLLRLNDEGFLNGHTPFSAMLAFVTVLAAIVTGHRHIALSNESSANEATIEGTDINHQYSKSLRFESDFRHYVNRWITGDINYFSFLRPLNELQIASLFSKFDRYHTIFKSCNAGSRTDTWCGQCAKCLFTYIILSPFINDAGMLRIFGRNLFEDISLKPVFDQLTGIADEKPFDCVGTISEVNLALCRTIGEHKQETLPYLLEYYKNSARFPVYSQLDFTTGLRHLAGEHRLLPEFFGVLEKWVDG